MFRCKLVGLILLAITLPILANFIPLIGYPSHLCLQNFVKWAHQDVIKLHPETRPYVRYLTLYNIPRQERLMYIRTLSGHINALSIGIDIVPPYVVSDTQLSLIRIDVRDYGWEEVWEKLAEVDPYFHVRLVEDEVFTIETRYPGKFPSQWWRDSNTGAYWRYLNSRTIETSRNKVRGTYQIKADPYYGVRKIAGNGKKITAIAPWLDSRHYQYEVEELVRLTQSGAPIIRSDWFIGQTACQTDRSPGYYDFIRVKNEKDFHKLVGFDEKFLKVANRVQLSEAVSNSGVTQEPRRIAVFDVAGPMHFWRTFDVRKGIGQKNALRILDDSLDYDAEEAFGPLPNNFWAWGLFNADGTRQDSAPDFIGYDHFTRTNNGRIEVNISCIDCHLNPSSGGSYGIMPIDGWLRDIFSKDFTLRTNDKRLADDLRRRYFRDLKPVMQHDSFLYKEAVYQATGLDANKWGVLYSRAFYNYVKHVGMERITMDVGCNEPKLRKILKSHRPYGYPSLDIVVAGLLSGRQIPVSSYEEVFPLIMVMVQEYED